MVVSPHTQPEEQLFNDDLLVHEGDRKAATDLYPSVFKALYHPKLLDRFKAYENPANTARKHSRVSGLLAIALATTALMGAAAEPVFRTLVYPFPEFLGLFAAVAGIASIVIGWFGILHATQKQNWLHNRLMTERIRQFHFQSLIRMMPQIHDAIKNGSSEWRSFLNARSREFQRFCSEYEGHVPAKLSVMLKPEAESEVWLLPSSTPPPNSTFDDLREFFDAYRQLRIAHQLQFGNFKIRRSGSILVTPSKQRRALTGTGLLCIAALFFVHILVAVAVVAGFATTAFHAFVHNPWIHVVAIWIAIIALASRAVEGGLGVDSELHRYEHYVITMRALLHDFDDANSVRAKISVMERVECVSYYEMIHFLEHHDRTIFVM